MKRSRYACAIALGVFSISQLGLADESLLNQIRETGKVLGKDLVDSKDEIQEALNDTGKRLETLAKKRAKELSDRAKADLQKLETATKLDAVTARGIVKEEVSCTVQSLKDELSVQGGVEVKTGATTNRMLLGVTSLLSPKVLARVKESLKKREANLAIGIDVETQKNGLNFSYTIIDLDRVQADGGQTSLKIEDLDLKVDCKNTKRLIELKDGMPKINTDEVKKTVDEAKSKPVLKEIKDQVINGLRSIH